MTRKQLPRQPPRRRFLQYEQGFDIVQAMNTLFRRWFEGDECAFRADERTARPDVETYRAMLPSKSKPLGRHHGPRELAAEPGSGTL